MTVLDKNNRIYILKMILILFMSIGFFHSCKSTESNTIRRSVYRIRGSRSRICRGECSVWCCAGRPQQHIQGLGLVFGLPLFRQPF